jgi:AcrR family transcriptional regulator
MRTGGRLAGAVVAEEAEHRAPRHREVDLAQRPQVAEALAEALGEDAGVVVGCHVTEPSGRRAPRSRDDIAEAAIAVADAEGIGAVSMRRVAAELGLGTMSLYHYVRSKDELLDLMSDGIMGGQLVDDAELGHGWRAGLTAIAHATRRNFERHPWMAEAMRPRPSTVPGPNAMRHVDQSLAAVADTGADVQMQMELIAAVDDYVIGFVVRSQRFAEEEEQAADEDWMQALFDHLRGRIESGDYPHLQRALEANRTAGRSDEDLARMAVDEQRFERGLERLLDGIEVELSRMRKPVKRRRKR